MFLRRKETTPRQGECARVRRQSARCEREDPPSESGASGGQRVSRTAADVADVFVSVTLGAHGGRPGLFERNATGTNAVYAPNGAGGPPAASGDEDETRTRRDVGPSHPAQYQWTNAHT